MSWTSVNDKLPMDNDWCAVQAACTKFNNDLPFRFVRESDGDHFWDNLADEILQEHEVTHWKLA